MFDNGIPNPKLDKFYLGQAREFHFCVSKINQVSSKIPILVRWNKPSIGQHKLNTDGASIGNLGKAGGGGIIRDCHSDWVKGYSRSIGYTTSVLAKWWALRDGLILAIQLGINQLDVELDAKVIMELLNGAECPNQSYSPLLNDCRSLIARLVQFWVENVYREANQCVDFLAKRGCCMRENFVVSDVSPSADLNILIDSNKNGLYYYRHVANTLASVVSL